MHLLPVRHAVGIETQRLAGRNRTERLHRLQMRAGDEIAAHSGLVFPDRQRVVDAVYPSCVRRDVPLCLLRLQHRGDGVPPEVRQMTPRLDLEARNRHVDHRSVHDCSRPRGLLARI